MRPNIIVCPHGEEGFNNALEGAFNLLERGEVGLRLIQKIGRASHKIFIRPGPTSQMHASNAMAACIKGSGSDTDLQISTRTSLMLTYYQKGPALSFFFIELAHELIHGYHALYGKCLTANAQADKRVWSDDEEYQTIFGFPSIKDKVRKHPKITENAIRKEHGLEEIFSHMMYTKTLSDCYLNQIVDYQRVTHLTYELVTSSLRLGPPKNLFSSPSNLKVISIPIESFAKIKGGVRYPPFSNLVSKAPSVAKEEKPVVGIGSKNQIHAESQQRFTEADDEDLYMV